MWHNKVYATDIGIMIESRIFIGHITVNFLMQWWSFGSLPQFWCNIGLEITGSHIKRMRMQGTIWEYSLFNLNYNYLNTLNIFWSCPVQQFFPNLIILLRSFWTKQRSYNKLQELETLSKWSRSNASFNLACFFPG